MTYNKLLKNGLSDKGKGIKWLDLAFEFLNSNKEVEYYNDCNLTIAIKNVCNKLKLRYCLNSNGVWFYYK